MTEPSGQESIYKDVLDEILFRDPSQLSRQTEVTNGMTKRKEVITFADGSQLIVAAQVPLPPLADMTPARVFFVKPDGKKGHKWDDGSKEAVELAGKSIAMRFIERISTLLDELPEREKVICSSCDGKGRCLCCNGKGCLSCENRGRCPECHGRGLVPKE